MPTPETITNLELAVSLRTYFDARFQAIDKAQEVAYEAMEKRLSGMNEFRDTLRDQAGRFITRTEMETVKDRIEVEIKDLREFKARLEGKASQQSVMIAYALSILGLLMGVVGLLRK